MHDNHKVLEITDEESLKKENISIEDSIKNFGDDMTKSNELKSQIEKEINNINLLYEKTIEDLTSSYKQKHEKLINEENDLKDKVNNEVTRIKEKLEKYLDKLNKEIKMNEKIKKGLKNIENEKNMIVILSYISKINKNKKGINLLFQELMTSSKISYDKNENDIKFEKYYFNGAPIPKNIDYNFKELSSIEINWQIDDLQGIDKNNIKFKMELRKENKEFEQIYESEKNNFTINNLQINENYELRICSIYNDVNSLWSEIFKFMTKDSVILLNSKKSNEFLNKIYEWCGYKNMELIFRGTRDGMFSQNFHSKCDGKGPTITLFRNDKGNIFGGYSPIKWNNSGGYKNENRCFIFTLSNIYNIEPTKFPSKNNGSELYFDPNYGPCFYDTWVGKDFINNTTSYLGSYYQDIVGKGHSIFTGNKDNGNQKIILNEVEVFELK